MKPLYLIAAAAALALVPASTFAQFVKGNEAVKVMPDGSKRVETPPQPAATLATPCPAAKAGCAGGGWKMVETDAGLVECTEFYARPGTCRPSTYGAQKFARVWVVKTKSQWMQCQYPDLTSKCVSTKALPYDAVQ
jgi:hypothetical protein